MPLVCGIEIKSNEAILALIEIRDGTFEFIKSSINKFQFNADNQEQYKSFFEVFSQFIKQNNISAIYLKKPVDKGQQISGPNSFRIETLINLTTIQVYSIHPNTLAAFAKRNTVTIVNIDSANKYQYNALLAAQYGISNR